MITPPIIRLPGGYEAAKAKGWGAHNTMFTVSIHTGLNCFAAILAQEVYEWRLKWLVGLALALPIAAAAYLLAAPEAYILGGLLGAVALIVNVRLIPPLHARMELVSHMIETLIAVEHYGKDHDSYATSEASIMSTHYGQFKGWGVEKVLSRMLGYTPNARQWVKRHAKWIGKEAA